MVAIGQRMRSCNMENILYESVTEVIEPETSKVFQYKAVIDNTIYFIPLDPTNRHYAEIMRQVEAGTLVIQEAE